MSRRDGQGDVGWVNVFEASSVPPFRPAESLKLWEGQGDGALLPPTEMLANSLRLAGAGKLQHDITATCRQSLVIPVRQ